MGESGGSAQRRADELQARGRRSAGAWAAGADGERRVAAELEALGPEWLVLHDRLLVPGRSESNLDHVLVGPGGVVLLDTKNWAGRLSEHEGVLFKHAPGADGVMRHRPVERDLAGVHRFATEMARRLHRPVCVAVVLAGRHAASFGDPRVVSGVWVVPIGHLVEWVRGRPTAPPEDVQSLRVLVTTEFPSTTTDWRLLAAMGTALDGQPVVAGISSVGWQTSRRPGAGPRPVAGRPPARQRPRRTRPREGRARRVVGLLAIAGLVWAASSGALGAVLGGVFASVTGLARPVSAAPSPVPAPLSCASLDPRTVTGLETLVLMPTPIPGGCRWVALSRSGTRRTVLEIQSQSASEPGYQVEFGASRGRGGPFAVRASANAKPAVAFVVAETATVTVDRRTTTSSRGFRVLVAPPAAGKTAGQARLIALRVAEALARA